MNNKVLIGVISGIAILGVGGWLVFGTPMQNGAMIPLNSTSTTGTVSTSTTPNPTSTTGGAIITGTFGKSVTFRIGDKINFSDGFSLTLKEINDSRCQSGVVCIWQGELSGLFSATFKGSSQEVRLGTVNNKGVSIQGHTIVLQSATTNSVSLVVESEATVPAASGVTGYIHIGPTCPVERIPPDPNCADRAFANANVVIRNASNGSIVSRSASDANGNFRVALVPGTYTIDASPSTGGSLPRCETKSVVVTAGQFASVDMSCDSGIR